MPSCRFPQGLPSSNVFSRARAMERMWGFKADQRLRRSGPLLVPELHPIPSVLFSVFYLLLGEAPSQNPILDNPGRLCAPNTLFPIDMLVWGMQPSAEGMRSGLPCGLGFQRCPLLAVLPGTPFLPL